MIFQLAVGHLILKELNLTFLLAKNTIIIFIAQVILSNVLVFMYYK